MHSFVRRSTRQGKKHIQWPANYGRKSCYFFINLCPTLTWASYRCTHQCGCKKLPNLVRQCFEHKNQHNLRNIQLIRTIRNELEHKDDEKNRRQAEVYKCRHLRRVSNGCWSVWYSIFSFDTLFYFEILHELQVTNNSLKENQRLMKSLFCCFGLRDHIFQNYFSGVGCVWQGGQRI